MFGVAFYPRDMRLMADWMREQLDALVLEMFRRGILYREAVEEFKKVFIRTVLRANNDNQSRSAKQLGVHRNTLTRTILAMHIDVRGVRGHPKNCRHSHGWRFRGRIS